MYPKKERYHLKKGKEKKNLSSHRRFQFLQFFFHNSTDIYSLVCWLSRNQSYREDFAFGFWANKMLVQYSSVSVFTKSLQTEMPGSDSRWPLLKSSFLLLEGRKLLSFVSWKVYISIFSCSLKKQTTCKMIIQGFNSKL